MAKHAPSTREEFKRLMLRRLGAPVISINVSEDQIEDCVEESLKYFTDYHYDGSEQTLSVFTVTQPDIDNRYINVPDSLFGIRQVYTKSSSAYSSFNSGMFGSDSQQSIDFTFNNSSGGTMVTYYASQMQYGLMQQMLVGPNSIRFNRHLNKVNFDFNWSNVSVGDKIIIEGYTRLDPDVVTEIWNDRWLAKYATAKLKYVWGSILSKFESAPLPNGGTINGSKIQDDAKDEIQALEDEMLTNYSIPPGDMIL